MSDWRPLRLIPDDVLFFRDGKPSAQGQDHDLRSLFPPSPSTVFGALRTHRLVAEGVPLAGLTRESWSQRLGSALAAELGAWGGFGTLSMRGPWLTRGKEALVPAPQDLAVVTETKAEAQDPVGEDGREGPEVTQDEGEHPIVKAVGRFRLAGDPSPGGASHPLARLEPQRWTGTGWERWKPAPGKSDPQPAAGWWLTLDGLAAWQRGEVPLAASFVSPRDLWAEEPRTGVGLQAGQRTSEEHQLYTFGLIRLRPEVALGFEVRGGHLAAPATLRLGGEGRTARLEPGTALDLVGRAPAGRRFWLSFLTPSLSAAGALPPGFRAGQPEGTLGGRRCRLLAAVVPGFALVGGWDLARRQPKPLRRALPPGASFLLEDLEPEPPFAATRLAGATLTDDPGEHLAQQGFGLAVTALAD